MGSSTASGLMRAAVTHAAGAPSVGLKLESIPIPVPTRGQILIRVKAVGLNRSELYTRRGDSPGVKFPRVLGIEAVGLVVSAPGSEAQFPADTVVATAMGGMGREFDGGYAEYTCVNADQVQKVTTKLPWEKLGALPELMQTVWGSLFTSLELKRGDNLLIRGGTSAIGLCAAALAKKHGAFVTSTTRKPAREAFLREKGADDVIIDSGEIKEAARKLRPNGFDKVLELSGTTTLADSLQCARRGGFVCMTGILGGAWTFEKFVPNYVIPVGVKLTTYSSSVQGFMDVPLEDIARQVADGSLSFPMDKVFKLDDIVAAHELMESNEAQGKVVVLT